MSALTRLKSMVRSIAGPSPQPVARSHPEATADVAKYWTRHNVTNHKIFASRQDSLNHFHWRNDQYIGYIDLMPVSGRDGEVVVDFGCGPGHDLVGFAQYSKPRRIVGIDVSSASLAESEARLSLHDVPVELYLAAPGEARLPLDDASVDYLHCSGVLHHIPDPMPVLREFRRILKPGGKGRIMVYFQDSVWYHLYVAYHLRRLNPDYAGLTQEEAFTSSTDGPGCPVSRCYSAETLNVLFASAGLSSRFVGASVSVFEMSLLPSRFNAIMDEAVDREHRAFIMGLTFDDRGVPMRGGVIAGIDGVFEFSQS